MFNDNSTDYDHNQSFYQTQAQISPFSESFSQDCVVKNLTVFSPFPTMFTTIPKKTAGA